MSLLGNSIAMQTSNLPPATLEYEFNLNGYAGTFRIYKNGSLYQTMTTNTSLTTVTLSTGETFYSTLQDAGGFGASIDYFVDNVYVTTYTVLDTSLLTTPTVTSSPGNTYKYIANLGVV